MAQYKNRHEKISRLTTIAGNLATTENEACLIANLLANLHAFAIALLRQTVG